MGLRASKSYIIDCYDSDDGMDETSEKRTSALKKGSSGEASSASILPSLSATPVHYFHITSAATEPQPHCSLSDWDTDKLIPPEQQSEDGLRRSKRTRVKRLEWYKNERIIYDRRESGPVIVAVQPSRERLYLEQQKLKRIKRHEGYLVRKKQQQSRGRPNYCLSTQLPLPKDVHLTPRSEVTVLLPHTSLCVHMACFNPASCATAMGPRGHVPMPDDPYTMTLLTQQRLFTTGMLTLAPAAEKPLKRVISTAVVFFVTFGKVLVTINRASQVMETRDHFFVPGGTEYKLKNLQREEAVLSFTNLMMEMNEQPGMQEV